MSQKRRVDRLEQRIGDNRRGPAYVSVESMADLGQLGHVGWGCKVYVTVSPDDWPATADSKRPTPSGV